MRVRCFYPNKDGKIEMTREELEKLLNDVYDEGRLAGRNETPVSIPTPLTTPNYPYNPCHPYDPIWYNTPYITCNDTESNPYKDQIYCTNDNSIGRITLEPSSINTTIRVGEVNG